MSGRELVILLLGLAIVAVVLRGLYVAINARRGQIKLAIDKNIPQDVDLESLELAELPGGGARVVTRSLEEVNRQNSALDLAETKAKSLNLTDTDVDSHIPVLMDAVELSESAPARASTPNTLQRDAEAAEEIEETTEDELHDEAGDHYSDEQQAGQIEDEVEADFIAQADQEHSLGDNWDDAEVAVGQAEVRQPQSDDSDSLLVDYPEEELESREVQTSADAMASIAPDYDDASQDEELDSVEMHEANVELSESDTGEPIEENFDEEQDEEESIPFDADSTADEFSMTAGERIGGNPPAIGEANQSGLFDEPEEENEDAAIDKPKNRPSLFSLFGRKSKSTRVGEQVADEEAAESETEYQAIDEPADVLLEEEYEQLDIEEVVNAEPVYQQMASEELAADDEIVDELDQKRTSSNDHEVAAQEPQSEELEHSEVLVLNIAAKDGRVFAGEDLLHVLITAGLKFGEMNIFHKRLSKEHQGTVIFSVANMLNPGTFDLNNMDDFTTLGISFFLALPSPINNLDAFEQMLGVAQEIRDTLDGDLKDDHRNGMTGQTIEHYRQRIRDFELRRLKAVAARG